jgi:UDP-N-acetylglucosamine 2-epimerase (non-hydrolysing)
MKNIAIVIGTRPEYIKCLPLLKSSNIYKLIYVEQHNDLISIEHEHLKLKIIHYSESRLNNIISSLLHSSLLDTEWDAILVQGDTVVAFAAALMAFNKQIKVIHLEAGLRTYDNDNPYPEEGYRKMIDSIASIGLCPSSLAAENLKREGFGGKIIVVGNTSIDAIKEYKLIPQLSNKILITLHRRENWPIIDTFFEVIEELAMKYPDLEFIFPMHPNPIIKKHINIFKKVKVIEPLDHKLLCSIIAECNSIISDSGGIQEEASYLGKKIFCCRKVTERVELLNNYVILTATPEDLFLRFSPQTEIMNSSTVYGYGDACEKINSYLLLLH